MKPTRAVVIADDTDVFVLLLYFCHTRALLFPTFMTSPVQGRTMIDIEAKVTKHSSIISNLLAALGLTGFDTVATCYGIGKGVSLNVLCTNKYFLTSF